MVGRKKEKKNPGSLNLSTTLVFILSSHLDLQPNKLRPKNIYGWQTPAHFDPLESHKCNVNEGRPGKKQHYTQVT